MDQNLSTVIIACMTGIFSTLALIIQRRQDKIINKIDEQTLFIEKEKALRQRLIRKEKERESIIQEMFVIILDTNLHILKNTQIAGASLVDEKIYDYSEELKIRFGLLTESIKDMTKEYDMILDMSKEYAAMTERNHNDNKK